VKTVYFLFSRIDHTYIRQSLHDGLALEETRLFGEGVEHFGRGLVGWGVADLVAVGDSD